MGLSQVVEGNTKSLYETVGCLAASERDFMSHYAKNDYLGWGEIVDLGCFLGSSTVALAIGLGENTVVPEEQKPNRIHAYDRFLWEAWMSSPVRGTKWAGQFEPGDSFIDLFQQQLGKWDRYVTTCPGDINQLPWESEARIEYLFVDAMKSWELCNRIIHAFYPQMVPGKSYLHHQDYVHFHTFWIHLTMFRMREYFTPVDHGFMAASRVFRYTNPLPKHLLTTTYRLQDFSTEEIDDSFDYALKIVHEEGHPNVLAAKARLYIELGDLELARQIYRDAIQRYPSAEERSELAMIRTMLN